MLDTPATTDQLLVAAALCISIAGGMYRSIMRRDDDRDTQTNEIRDSATRLEGSLSTMEAGLSGKLDSVIQRQDHTNGRLIRAENQIDVIQQRETSVLEQHTRLLEELLEEIKTTKHQRSEISSPPSLP